MSNLKKVLAMVLAVAMLLSMGITAGASAFSDVKDTDDYARAINLLASLQVLKGYEDGTYNAAGTYTREEFAKILYVLMTGKDDGAAMYAGTSPFADVAADRWSAGYINWAKNAKVISGREDGLFWPTDIVTYAEAAKMFVVAMGYDSTVYTFPYGFIDKAQTLSLFDDVSGMTANGPASRGTVAQMSFNALFAEAPRFGTYAAQVGSSSTTETKTYTVAEGAFNMEEVTTILSATSTVALDVTSFSDAGQVAITGGEGSAGTDIDEGAYDYDGDVDEYVGSEVVVWFRPAQSAAGTGSDTEEKIFDIQPSASNRIYDFAFADIDDDDTTSTKLVVEINGVDKKFTYDDDTDTITLEGDDDLDPTDLFVGDDATGLHSDKYRAIDRDNDGEIDLFVIDRTATGKISSLSSTRVTLSSVKGKGGFTGSMDIEDDDVTQVVVADGLAKSDYAVVSGATQYTESGYMTIYTLTKATKLEDAKLTKASSGYFYFDGTKYSIANESSLSAFTTSDVGNKYDIVLDVNGRIVACDETESTVSSDKWVLATDATISSSSSSGDLIKSFTGYLADGTKKTFSIADDLCVYDYTSGDDLDTVIDEDYPDGDDDTDLFDNVIYNYGTNSDGEVDELYTLAAVNFDNSSEYDSVEECALADSDARYSASTTVLSGTGADKAYIEDDTVVYVNYSTTKYKVLTGAELKKITADGWSFIGLVDDDGAYAVLKLVNASATSAPKATTDTYGVILKVDKDASDTDDEYVYTFTVAYDGKVEDLKTDSIDADDDFDDLVSDTIVGVYQITFDSSGYVDDVDEADVDDNYQTIIINKVKDGALLGDVVDKDNFAEGDSLDYALTGTYDEMTYDEMNDDDDVNVYQIDEYPVDWDNGEDILVSLDNDTDVSVVDTSALEESGDDLSYIALVIYDVDNEEISDIFYFSNPVETDADTTDPEFATNYPKAGDTQSAGTKKVQVKVEVDEDATVYYIVVANGADDPTDEEVMDGDDYGSVDVLAKGDVDVDEDDEETITITLSSDEEYDTAYDVYVVAEDNSGNLSTVEKVDVTTPSAS